MKFRIAMEMKATIEESLNRSLYYVFFIRREKKIAEFINLSLSLSAKSIEIYTGRYISDVSERYP